MAIKVEVFKTDSCPHCPAAVSAAESAKNKLGDQIDVEIVNVNEPVVTLRPCVIRLLAGKTIFIEDYELFKGNVDLTGLDLLSNGKHHLVMPVLIEDNLAP